jgi:hypothetical protein
MGGKKWDARLHTIRGRRVRKVVWQEKEREKGRRSKEGRAQSDEITSAFLNKSFINRACGLLFVC